MMPGDSDPKTDLVLGPYILGRMAVAQAMGKSLIEKNIKFEETERFSDEFLEYVAALTRLINHLSGIYDAIEEGFGDVAEGVFNRVVWAHTNRKADRKLQDQVDLLQQYLADPKPNASKLARESARNDSLLSASKLKNLNRWRKNGRLTDMAKLSLLLGINGTVGGDKVRPPTLRELCEFLEGLSAGKRD